MVRFGNTNVINCNEPCYHQMSIIMVVFLVFSVGISGTTISVIDYIDSAELKKLLIALDSSPNATAVVLYTVSDVWLKDPSKVEILSCKMLVTKYVTSRHIENKTFTLYLKFEHKYIITLWPK